MPPWFPASWVDQVYAASNIVEVVSQYVPLQSRGRKHWGLCPFHHEKTPSFSVSPDMNLYYCFGCKASGNIVQFVMEMEKLTYPEALIHLAKQFNVSPPPTLEDNPDEERRRSQRDRALEANREAAMFYHELLWTDQGRAALEYLHKRGFDDAVIRRFGLGASPDEWDSLMIYLNGKGFIQEELQQAALITVKESTKYDTFRNRVMFPIISKYGQTIGFGARAMGEVQPKYLNTSDSLVFNKRFNLYGIHQLKRQRNLKQLYLVEGYLDVISLAQAGIQNAVATLGTSLTVEQARLMKNYAPEIWISYDGDEAGQSAALRALDILGHEGIDSRVVPLPAGVDPDDFIRLYGSEAFKNLQPMAAMAFRLSRLENEFDFSDVEARRNYAKKACQMLNLLNEPVEVDYYLGKISMKTGISKGVLSAQMTATKGATIISQEERPRISRISKSDEQFSHPEFTLAALLASGSIPENLLKLSDFEEGPIQDLVAMLLEKKTPAIIMAESEDNKMRSLAGELFNRLPELDQESAISAAEDCLRGIRIAKLNKRIQTLTHELELQEEDQKLITLQLIGELQGERNRLSKT